MRKPRQKAYDPPPGEALPSTELSDSDFRYIRDLVQSQFGINLTEQKRSMVAGRLQKLLREMGLPDFRAYRRHLETNACGKTLDDLVNRISTNHTFFFREPEHFNFLRDTILPEIKAKRGKSKNRELRVWCAAASTGEEPYSILMTMLEFFGADYTAWDAGLLATDISLDALEAGRRGIYTPGQLKGVPRVFLHKYFQKTPDGNRAVREGLRREITFRRLNLVSEKFPFRKPFDVIFCRNVMIYFNQPTRDSLIKKLVQHLAPDGYLLVGHSESIGRSRPGLSFVRPAVYRRVSQ